MDNGLTVVIPAYNAADWLEPTIEKVVVAIRRAKIGKYEIIIVDDGSTDNSQTILREIRAKYKGCAKVISQENSGRFIARKRGVDAAKFNRILFVDTRTWIDQDALVFLKKQIRSHPERLVWNAHINVHKENNIIARFGDALTFLGWRRYFKKPRLVSYGFDDFDHYPKGTGLFNVPTDIIKEAIEWFETATTDVVNSSDDTLLIRHIAESNRIWLSPKYSGIYFARTTLLAFIKHTYYRGQFFVDGFLRPGTRFYYPIIVFLLASLVVLAVSTLWPSSILGFAVTLALLWFLELIICVLLGLGGVDAISLFILSPVFAITYGIGIWVATLRRMIK